MSLFQKFSFFFLVITSSHADLYDELSHVTFTMMKGRVTDIEKRSDLGRYPVAIGQRCYLTTSPKWRPRGHDLEIHLRSHRYSGNRSISRVANAFLPRGRRREFISLSRKNEAKVWKLYDYGKNDDLVDKQCPNIDRRHRTNRSILCYEVETRVILELVEDMIIATFRIFRREAIKLAAIPDDIRDSKRFYGLSKRAVEEEFTCAIIPSF